MLSGNHSFNILSRKKNRIEPISKPEHATLDDLATLVRQLSVQIEDLEHWKEESQIETKYTQQQDTKIQPLPALPEPTRNDGLSSKPAVKTTVIDPWASCVPQNYGALLQKLEDLENRQKCPNACCVSAGEVLSADGVPWPKPIEPFQSAAFGYYGNHAQSMNDMLDTQYTHWCTLLRCLPLMDEVTSVQVQTVGLYAMRDILKCKAIKKREHTPVHTAATPTKIRDSLSYSNLSENMPPTATQPSWLSSSETKVELATPSSANETVFTPTPSGFSSPIISGKKFHHWLKHKKMHRKANTDTAPTPLHQSQTLRKIGSWFF